MEDFLEFMVKNHSKLKVNYHALDKNREKRRVTFK